MPRHTTREIAFCVTEKEQVSTMSEFFKAAVKCDVTAAPKAPMYIDQTGVMEELYKHERLVEQTLKTKLFLDALDKDEGEAATKAPSVNDISDLVGPGVTVEKGLYREPPMSLTGLAKHPEQRNLGSRALEKSIESRLNLWQRDLSCQAKDLQQMDREEQRKAKDEEEKRRRNAERELNALITQRQLAAHEAEREALRLEQERRRQGTRAHPIDVLQKRIAADLIDEMDEGTRYVQAQLEKEDRGVDAVLEIEQLKEITYRFHSPLKYIPKPW